MKKTIYAITAATLIASVAVATPATASSKKDDRPVRFETNIVGPREFVKEEGTEAVFSFTGIAKGQKVRAVWSDGGETIVDTSKACKPADARKTPEKCTVTASHHFTVLGEGTVVLFVDGGAPRSSARVSIRSNAPAPTYERPPTPPHDWTLLFGDRAGFAPCSTITWSFDGATIAGRPDMQGLPGDVRLALDMVSEKSGLTFVQQDGYDADLVFKVGPMGEPDWLGYFRGGPGGGDIIISDTSERMTDKYAGADTRMWTPEMTPEKTIIHTGSGRVWTLIHETMHALGFGHVDSGAYEVMNTGRSIGGWGEGDLEGLATMYPRTNCPA